MPNIVGTWGEQYRRVKRYYSRFQDLSAGIEHTRDADYYQDDVYSFFVNCYHLKDWIQNDSSIKIDNGILYDYIRNSIALTISGEICNGMKHLSFNNRRGITRKDYRFSISSSGMSLQMKFYIDTEQQSYDALNIATECVKDWETFLSNHIKGFKPLP
jgi:hypothetical protein